MTNISNTDTDLSHTELCCYGTNKDQEVLLSSAQRIAANGFLAIFIDQINAPITLFPGGGTLELLSADTGAVLDTVMYPTLGVDQSYSRTANGTWSINSTPTPGIANTSNARPTPTNTRHAGSNGGGSPSATHPPVGSVFIPTDTPSEGVVLQSTVTSDSTDTGGGGNTPGVPPWLKFTLLTLLGVMLLGVLAWYFRTWSHVPEDES